MIDVVCDDDNDSHLGSKRFRRNLDAYIQRFNDVRDLYGITVVYYGHLHVDSVAATSV